MSNLLRYFSMIKNITAGNPRRKDSAEDAKMQLA